MKGDKVVFSYQAQPPPGVKKPGGGLVVTFTGAIESATRITGTLPVRSPYCSAGRQWTATKKKK